MSDRLTPEDEQRIRAALPNNAVNLTSVDLTVGALLRELDAVRKERDQLSKELEEAENASCWHCLNPDSGDPERHEHEPKGGHWHHYIDPGDGLPSPCKNSDVLERVFGQLAKELEEACTSANAMSEKTKALSPHGTCACSYDRPGDLCMHHSPQLAKAKAENERLKEWAEAQLEADREKFEQLEAENKRMREALEKYRDDVWGCSKCEVDTDHRGQHYSDVFGTIDGRAIAEAALKESE